MILLLLTHIAIALASVAWATIAALHPSVKKIYGSYGLMAATVSTGTVLVILSSRPLLSSCLMGVVYVLGMTAATIIAHVRMKHITASERLN